MFKTWEEVAKYLSKEYGTFVDWKERFYICPECDEPILEEDWGDREGHFEICPICEFNYATCEYAWDEEF